jgi:5'-nucleotidase
MQSLEQKQLRENPEYKKILRIAIVTARNAPAHERVVTTLKAWGVSVDEAFFLGGMEKSRILTILRPHMFFDDQISHLESPASDIPMVHIPFGIANRNHEKSPDSKAVSVDDIEGDGPSSVDADSNLSGQPQPVPASSSREI